MIGWWIALGVILLLFVILLLPLGISFRFDDAGLRIGVIIGLLKLTVFPNKWLKKIDWAGLLSKKSKPAEGTASPKPDSQPEGQIQPVGEPAQPQQPKTSSLEQIKDLLQGGQLKEFIPLVELLLELLDDFRWKLRVNRIELQFVLACDDPCDLAILYGQAWSAVGNLFPILERSMVIKKRNIEILCDFMADKPRVKARLDLTITIGRLLLLGGKHGIKILLKFLDIYKTFKGGAIK